MELKIFGAGGGGGGGVEYTCCTVDIVYDGATFIGMDWLNDTEVSNNADFATVFNAVTTYIAAFPGGRIHVHSCPVGTANYQVTVTLVDNGADYVIVDADVNVLLYLANAANCDMMQINGQTGWIITHLRFDGNKANQTASPAGYACIELYDCDECTVDSCWTDNAYQDGDPTLPNRGYCIFLIRSRNCIVNNNHVKNGDYGGIGVYHDNAGTNSEHNIVSNNHIVENNIHCGIQCAHGNYSVIINNTIYLAQIGILFHTAWSSIVMGNECYSGLTGIQIYSESNDNIIALNMVHDNDGYYGINMQGTLRCIIIGNIIYNQEGVSPFGIGIMIDGFANNQNLVVCNQSYLNDLDGIRVNGTTVETVVLCNICIDNGGYGIRIDDSTLTETLIALNRLRTNTSGAILDNGTRTMLPTLVFMFDNGSDPQDSGYLINGAGEYARTYMHMPYFVQQVVRIRILARSVVTNASGMRIEIVSNAGAVGEAYNTHDGGIDAITGDAVVANNIVQWVRATAPYTSWLGGDSIELKVTYRASSNGDEPTNAYFRTVVVEHV